jgi:hypothetical protein
VAQLYPQSLRSLYVVSYDSQGYGGGILTLTLPGGTGPCIYSIQELDGPIQSQVKVKVKSQSHVTADGQSISMSWCLVHLALTGFHPKIFNWTSGGLQVQVTLRLTVNRPVCLGVRHPFRTRDQFLYLT